MSFTLQSATQFDASTLSSIFGDAFATDTQTQIKMEGKGPGEMIKGMKGEIEAWINNTDRCTVTKAVENKSNTIMGWVCWGLFGYGKTACEIASEGDTEEHSDQEQETSQASLQASDDLARTPLEQLEAITNEDMQRWMNKIMPKGSKCRYIVCIVVDPRFQRRGVASALIELGTDQADKDGVLCWVQASEAGYKSFRHHGFTVKETLEVDLDKYTSLPPPDELDKWGGYTFRYMVRGPKGR